MVLSEATSRQYNLSIVGGNVMGTYRFLTGFYGLGDMPNEFQRVLYSMVGPYPGVHEYIDDILIARRGSPEGHWRELRKVLQMLNQNNAAAK